MNVLFLLVGLGLNRLNLYAANDCVSGPAKSVSSVASDSLSSSCSCSRSEVYSSSSGSGSVSDIKSSGSAVDLGKPLFPVSKPSSGCVASVNSGESGRVASHSVRSGVSDRVNSRSSSSSGSSASMNGSSLEAELSSEFNPKVPRRLVSLDVVVSEFIGSKFRYVA